MFFIVCFKFNIPLWILDVLLLSLVFLLRFMVVYGLYLCHKLMCYSGFVSIILEETQVKRSLFTDVCSVVPRLWVCCCWKAHAMKTTSKSGWALKGRGEMLESSIRVALLELYEAAHVESEEEDWSRSWALNKPVGFELAFGQEAVIK